jgi:signal transduction histidine kinase
MLSIKLRLRLLRGSWAKLAADENPDNRCCSVIQIYWRYDIIIPCNTSFFANHPVACNKSIEFQKKFPDILINTDFSLLSRVLCNMVINALETSGENDIIRFWLEQESNLLSFCVWNAQEIPQEIAGRVFQRNFSTKEQAGKGIGTFSVKLFGEEILGGRVWVRSSQKEGTIFSFSPPI